MKRIRRDLKAEERLAGLFVFAATFISVSALFLWLMSDTVESGSAGRWEYLEGYNTLGLDSLAILDPEEGYLANESIQSSWSGTDNALLFDGDPIGIRDLYVSYIRDNTEYTSWDVFEFQHYRDYFMCYVSWGWWSFDWQAISLEMVYANQIGNTNISVSHMILGENNYSLVIETWGSPDIFYTCLFNSLFTIYVGVPTGLTFDSETAEHGMWTVVKQILTAQLPDVGPVVNLLIAVPFWSAFGFAALMLFSRFIPLIPGG